MATHVNVDGLIGVVVDVQGMKIKCMQCTTMFARIYRTQYMLTVVTKTITESYKKKICCKSEPRFEGEYPNCKRKCVAI